MNNYTNPLETQIDAFTWTLSPYVISPTTSIWFRINEETDFDNAVGVGNGETRTFISYTLGDRVD